MVPTTIVLIIIFIILYVLGGIGPSTGSEFDSLGLIITTCGMVVIILVAYFIGLSIDIANRKK